MGPLIYSLRQGSRNCGLSAAFGLLVLWLPASAAGQSQSSGDAPPHSGARKLGGVCQCTADPGSPRKRCLSSEEACEALCANPTYSFEPLKHNALAICPAKELYVDLPYADGRPGAGAITVSEGGKETTLDEPYEAEEELEDGEDAEIEMSQEEEEEVFHDSVGSRPVLPRRFILRFEPGSDKRSPESTTDYRALLDDIKNRPAYEVEIAGYADTAANETADQRLSGDRAKAVAAALTGDGIDQRAITIGAYGTRAPAATGGDAAESRNRRVEVWVR